MRGKLLVRMTRLTIKENSIFARIAAWKLGANQVAMVLGSTIHLHGCTKSAFLSNTKWLRHEVAHVHQWQKFGKLKFIYRYLIESLKKGYYNNRFEAEARSKEEDLDLLNDFYII